MSLSNRWHWLMVSVFICLVHPAAAYDCDDSALSAMVPPASGAPRSDIMVVVNDNSPASCAVALAYARARSLGRYNLIHVRTPTNYTIDWVQFRLLRDQILREMRTKLLAKNPSLKLAICPATDINPDPDPAKAYQAPFYYCQASVAQLDEQLGVNYLVTTMGVPTRVQVDIKDSELTRFPNEPGSVDNHLRFALTRYFKGRVSAAEAPRSIDAKLGWNLGYIDLRGSGGKRELRTEVAAQDRNLVVGRIDGITVDAAVQMIARTLQAERAGVRGKFYYPTSALQPAPWPLGVFAVAGSPCADLGDSNFYWTRRNPSPAECAVHLAPATGAVDIARAGTLQPRPDSALLYSGNLDGQASAPGTFDGLLNWRRQAGANCPSSAAVATLTCDDPALSSTQQATCRAHSIDALGEINSQCVGVNPGFVGAEYISYPLSYFTVWPTDWKFITAYGSSSFSGDAYTRTGFLRSRDNDGSGDSHSLWIGNDVVANYTLSGAKCYGTSLAAEPAASSCDALGLNNRSISAMTELDLSRIALPVVRTKDAPTGTMVRFTVSFDYKVNTTQQPAVSMQPLLYVHRLASNDNPVAADRMMTYRGLNAAQSESIVLNNTAGQWLHSSFTFDIGPDFADCTGTPLVCGASAVGWNGRVDKIALAFQSLRSFQGLLGLDNVSVTLDGDATRTQLVRNGSFDQGHHQLAVGDYAATFLNRLGGTAFFGSVGHYTDAGFSLNDHDTILRSFWRGLPLGDAVWLQNDTNGDLYGDPLYSPVAVRLEATSGLRRTPYRLFADKRASDHLELRIAAVNGRASNTATSYAIDVCSHGEAETSPDFYNCDSNQLWDAGAQSSNLAGTGGTENIAATLDIAGWPIGWYTLRLRVTRQFGSESVTYNDFLTFQIEVQQDIHVQPSATPGGDGFPSAPYSSLDTAYQQAVAGDRLLLHSGDYPATTLSGTKAVSIAGWNTAETRIAALTISNWNAATPQRIRDLSVGRLSLSNTSPVELLNVIAGSLSVNAASLSADHCLLAPGMAGAPAATKGIQLAQLASTHRVALNFCTIAGFDQGLATASSAVGGQLSIRNSIFANATNIAGPASTQIAYTVFAPQGTDAATWAATAPTNKVGAPDFKNIALGDFHLGHGSAARNAGDPAEFYQAEPRCSWPVVDAGFFGGTRDATCGAQPTGALELLLH